MKPVKNNECFFFPWGQQVRYDVYSPQVCAHLSGLMDPWPCLGQVRREEQRERDPSEYPYVRSTKGPFFSRPVTPPPPAFRLNAQFIAREGIDGRRICLSSAAGGRGKIEKG